MTFLVLGRAFVARPLGAGRFDRAEASAIVTAKYSAVLMSFFTAIFVFLAPLLVGAFTDDAEISGFAIDAIRGLGVGFIFYGVGMVMTQALNGAGATRVPTWINVFCFWVFQAPVAYFVAKHTAWGAHGVIYAIPAAHGILALLAWRIFRIGRWKRILV